MAMTLWLKEKRDSRKFTECGLDASLPVFADKRVRDVQPQKNESIDVCTQICFCTLNITMHPRGECQGTKFRLSSKSKIKSDMCAVSFLERQLPCLLWRDADIDVELACNKSHGAHR